MAPEPPEYLAFLAPYPAETQALHRAIRQKLISVLPPAVEHIFDATQTVTTGWSFTTRHSDHFIHLPIYAKHVNLGFAKGAALLDPEGRLVGRGTTVRHVKLSGPEDLDDAYLLNLIEEAMSMAPRPAGVVVPGIKIHVMKGPKRRPSPAPQKPFL